MKYLPPEPSFEDFLSRLNEAVAREFANDDPLRTDLLTAQVVGLPRSGTTILFQLLARTGNFGYPSNIMAMYWKAPEVGATIQARLSHAEPQIGLNSIAGRTADPLGPHEFGYFWRNALGHVQNSVEAQHPSMSPRKLQRQLNLVNSAFGKPTVYKNFLAPFHLPLFEDHLQNQKLIYIKRPKVGVATSLLSVRRKLNLTKDDSFGIIPTGMDTNYQDEIQLVSEQVRLLDHELLRTGAEDSRIVHVVHYEELCNDTHTTLKKVATHLDQDVNLSSVPRKLSTSKELEHVSETERHRIAEHFKD